MPRVRVLFEKTGFTCFVSHLDLPIVFARAARRAGIDLEMTQGFSPHSRMTLALPLPVGVIGLREPIDFWPLEWTGDMMARWNESLPPGLRFVACEAIGDGPSLSKFCKASSYVIKLSDAAANSCDIGRVADVLKSAAAEADCLLEIRVENGEIRLAVQARESFGPNHMTKRLVEDGAVSGWKDLVVVRCDIGGWDEATRSVIPLVDCK